MKVKLASKDIKKVRVRRTDPWFTFRPRLTIEAKDDRGNVVGTLKIRKQEGSNNWKVYTINVEPGHRRKGVATRLYEEAARTVEARHGQQLCSDFILSPEAKGFWEKQVSKGHAQKQIVGPATQYCLLLPTPASLGKKKSPKN